MAVAPRQIAFFESAFAPDVALSGETEATVVTRRETTTLASVSVQT
jgi:hypothetical protein